MMRANVCGGPSVGTQSVGFECFRGRCTFVQLLREIVMVRSRQALSLLEFNLLFNEIQLEFEVRGDAQHDM